MRHLPFIAFLFLLLPLSPTKAQNHHFWDGIETFDGPTDENPILAAQIDYYFDKLVAPLPDSITLEISRLIERTESNIALRDFILWHLLEKYRHPEYMSQDQVFVWLYDQYFSQLEIKDLNATNRTMIQEKAERLRRLALFNPAPNFKLTTKNGETIELQSVEGEYIVLFFYDHDCAICHQEMQDLDSVCKEHAEITVLALDMNPESSDETDSSGGFAIRPKRKEDLKSSFQHRRITNPSELNALYNLYDIETTPLIFVLDKDKRIIAKKIQAKQIPLIL